MEDPRNPSFATSSTGHLQQEQPYENEVRNLPYAELIDSSDEALANTYRQDAMRRRCFGTIYMTWGLRLRSVHQLCDELKAQDIGVDIAVLNAGLATLRARRTPQGFETMFAVHFLANRVIVDRWLKDGLLRPSGAIGDTPRIVFVASETHRSSDRIDFESFGAYHDFRCVKNALKQYCSSKLHMCTYANELSRRLNPAGDVAVAVHAVCPGAIASGIAREAPAILKPIINPLMKLVFQSPQKPAEPVIYLCCAEEAGARTGIYLHMMKEKQASALALDEANGTKLWEASETLVAKHAATAGAAPDGG